LIFDSWRWQTNRYL